ncbi:hypothetical protein SDC9_131434 [bioreactor metagenome]|uniref:Uncharacterized protein n=1 Tax=bioreactor metagenome TaxID=1076179 RepID=A0A645D5X3_9ZZZZ
MVVVAGDNQIDFFHKQPLKLKLHGLGISRHQHDTGVGVNQLHHGVQSRLRAGNLKHRVGAHAVRRVKNVLSQVRLLRVHRREPKLPGLFNADGIYLGNHHLKPQIPGNQRRHQSDGAAADDHGVVPALGLGALQRMEAHGQRLHQRAVKQADALRQAVERALMDRPAVAHGAPGIQPHEVEVGTAVVVPLFAYNAVLAVVQRANRHAVARLPSGDALAHRSHNTGALVADGPGKGFEPIVIVAVVNVQVRAADAAVGHVHLHLMGLGGSGLVIMQGKSVVALVQIRFHKQVPLF